MAPYPAEKIQINTDQMRIYADALMGAQRHVMNARLDVAVLQGTDPVLSRNLAAQYENYLLRCVEYLETTASAFDRAERDIGNRFEASRRPL